MQHHCPHLVSPRVPGIFTLTIRCTGADSRLKGITSGLPNDKKQENNLCELKRARGCNGYGELKLVKLPKSEASNGKVLVRMTGGGKRMYVVLISHDIAARGETPVLPSTEANNNV
jgi:hypothetical protein